MPITIDGTGTIAGLSAGGLPDASVTLAELATTVASGVAKAWVNFNGSGTVAIRASFNCTSITDNGIGTYTVNFTNALADTNYAASVTSRRSTNTADMNFSATLKPTASANTNYPLTTTSCAVICGTVSNSTFTDSDVFCVVVFR